MTYCILQILLIFVCLDSINLQNDFLHRQTNLNNERIHVQKCRQYQSAVYDYIGVLALVAGGQGQKFPIDKCGHKKIPLIVGGVFTQPREFPHSCLLGFSVGRDLVNWACGSTLISDRYVLTAAHCTFSKKLGEPEFVRCGDLDLNITTDDAKPAEYIIEDIIIHPNYRLSTKYNDIALVRTNTPIALGPYVRPACLPTQFDGPEKNLIATGWGKTQWGGESSNYLQKVILEKIPNAECNQIYSRLLTKKSLPYGIQEELQICAGSHGQVKDTCQGDSGGPLQAYHHTEYCMYTIVGITSFGIRCGVPGVPGIYTRVFPYIDWIENIVWQS